MSVARGEFQQTFLKLFYIDDCQLRAIEEGEKKKKKSPILFLSILFFFCFMEKRMVISKFY